MIGASGLPLFYQRLVAVFVYYGQKKRRTFYKVRLFYVDLLQTVRKSDYFLRMTNDFAGTFSGTALLSAGVPVDTSTRFL